MNPLIFIGPAIGLAALITTIIIYRKNRRPKHLRFWVSADQPILSRKGDDRWGKLSVRLGSKSVKEPRIVTVDFINIGRTEARADDFDEPVSINTQDGDIIVAATILLKLKDSATPTELVPDLEPTKVTAPNTLLNEGDALEFRLLLDGTAKPVLPHSRVAGFKVFNLNQAPPGTRHQKFIAGGGGILYLAVATLILILVAVLVIGDPPKVPDVSGMTIEDAVVRIREADLRPGDVTRVDSRHPAGVVLWTNPSPDEFADKDKPINFVVSDGP